MNVLSKEQIKEFAEKYGISEQEVLEKEKILTSTFEYQWNTLKESIINIWEQIKPHVFNIVSIYKNHKHEQTVKFFMKKKSQKKNWKKWKKRK